MQNISREDYRHNKGIHPHNSTTKEKTSWFDDACKLIRLHERSFEKFN